MRGGAWCRRLAALGVAGALVGCAGVRLEEGAYVVRDKGYRVVPPTGGWVRIDSDADLALREASVPAGLMAAGTCDGRPPSRPLGVLARHLRFGLRDVRDLEESPVEVGGRPGLKSRFTARLDGSAVTVQAVTLRSAACVYDLVVVAPPERLDAVLPAFEEFVRSFRVVPGTGQ